MKSKIVALSKNEDFKNLLKKKKVSNKYITLFFGPLADKDNKKLNISFVVKKKLIRGAVKRNKIKRRLRNIMNEVKTKISKIYLRKRKSQTSISLFFLVLSQIKIIKN